MHHESLSESLLENIMGFCIKKMPVKSVLVNMAGGSKSSPSVEAAGFTTQVIILSHPFQIHAGVIPVPDFHRSHVACKFGKKLVT